MSLSILLPASGCAATEADASRQSAVHRGWITGLAELDGRIYSCSQAGIFVRTGGFDRLIHKPRFRVTDLAAASHPSRPHLLACGGEPAERGTLLTLDPNGRVIKSLDLGQDLVYAVSASPDGRRGAAACADGSVYIFALPSLERLELVLEHNAPARAVVFSPDGSMLATAGLDGLIHLARVVRRRRPRILTDHSAGVECLAFSPDGGLLASGARDGMLRLHDATGRLERTWHGRGVELRDLDWHPEGRRVYACLADGRVLEHPLSSDTAFGREIAGARDESLFSVLVSRSGLLLAAGRRIREIAATSRRRRD